MRHVLVHQLDHGCVHFEKMCVLQAARPTHVLLAEGLHIVRQTGCVSSRLVTVLSQAYGKIDHQDCVALERLPDFFLSYLVLPDAGQKRLDEFLVEIEVGLALVC